MAMDIFTIEAVTEELKQKLSGALIKKIHQPDALDIVFRFWTGSREYRLLVAADPRRGCLYLTEKAWPNPSSPPRFCQLLRARLSRLVRIEQVANERIVQMIFAGSQGERYDLYVELIGGHSNVILVDENGRIVDVLKRIEGEGQGRSFRAGDAYELPPPRGRLRLADPLDELPDSLRNDRDVEDWLMREMTPMTRLVARDLAAGISLGIAPEEVLSEFRTRWLDRQMQPATGWVSGRPVLLPYELRYLDVTEARGFDSMSEAAEDYYSRLVAGEGNAGGISEMADAVRRGLKRIAVRLDKLTQESERTKDPDRMKQCGDLLMANLYRISRGASEVIVEDFYADPPRPLSIALDPLLSPQENAERCFLQFKKAKRAVGHLARRLDESREEETWLQGVALSLDEAQSAEDLDAIRTELQEAGFLKVETRWRGNKRASTDTKSQLHRCKSPGGYELYWGKNNRSNDYVSRHLTASDDLWFHAKDIPGTHLVLKRQAFKGNIPDQDMLFAAALAAGYSRAKSAGKVEVIVAKGHHVHKPKGARPGLVTVDQYFSVVVAPMRL